MGKNTDKHIDYYAVDNKLGNWNDIEKLFSNFNLMFDAVINHSSQYCNWFQKFLNDDEQFNEFYVEMDSTNGYANVVRPRTTPLSHKYKGRSGIKEVWTTFSKNQVDLNFKNPKVLLQILDILLFYISKGAKIIRLDAVGFLWKEKNTTSIHLPQTHQIIKVMRKVIEKKAKSAMLLSETNVPHHENISYFGNGDEAHMVYNFTLPPLLAYTILSGNTKKLTEWASTLKLHASNVCFFNFLASHDGIGLRPVDNILIEDEINIIISSAKANDGKISYKSNSDGNESPYEINCNYFSLLKGNEKNETLGIRRTIIAHAILLTLPGLPAIYFHSIFGLENDLVGMNESGITRRINREKIEYESLSKKLKDKTSRQYQILSNVKALIQKRKTYTAFNPYSSFNICKSENGMFIIERTSIDGRSVVKGYFNLSRINKSVTLNLDEVKTDILSGKTYKEILNLESLNFVWLKIK